MCLVSTVPKFPTIVVMCKLQAKARGIVSPINSQGKRDEPELEDSEQTLEKILDWS